MSGGPFLCQLGQMRCLHPTPGPNDDPFSVFWKKAQDFSTNILVFQRFNDACKRKRPTLSQLLHHASQIGGMLFTSLVSLQIKSLKLLQHSGVELVQHTSIKLLNCLQCRRLGSTGYCCCKTPALWDWCLRHPPPDSPVVFVVNKLNSRSNQNHKWL